MAATAYSVIVLVVSQWLSAAGQPSGCGLGWLTYNNMCYKFSNKKGNWMNARVECNRYDASLLRIHSQAELDFVTTNAAQHPSAGYWTDLNDRSRQSNYARGTGIWRWGGSEVPDMKLIQWTQAPASDGVANCSGINNQGKLTDVDCGAFNGYICVLRSWGRPAGSQCPAGWVNYGYSCYYLSNSSDSTDVMPWANARDKCSTLSPSATLLIVNDQYDAAFVQSELPKLSTTMKLHWIGLTYQGNNAWRWWIPNIPAQNMITWSQPSASVAAASPCVSMTAQGLLVPAACATTQSFICGFSSTTGCPLGWLPTDTNCYWVGNTSDPTQQLSFTAANSWCQQKASTATLLVIDDPNDLSFLNSQEPYLDSTYRYWIGLQYTSNTYKWVNGAPFNGSLVKWFPPSNAVSQAAPCAGLNTKGKAVPMACNTMQGAICSARSDSGCPLGWLSRGSNCYWVVNDTRQFMSWSAARDWCTRNFSSATLFIIKDQYDLMFYQNELPYLNPGKLFWIGLTFQTSMWKWYIGSEIGTGLLQWETEPNNVAGRENCGLLRMTGTFNDRSCYWWTNFICQKPVYKYDPAYNIGCGPWIRAGQNCYSFNKVKGASWKNARVYCQQQNADLIKVDNFDKMVWLQQQMVDPSNAQVFWIGLNDQAVDQTYVWADGTPLNKNLITWNQEPNDYKGQEDCAIIYTTGQYNDVSCNNQAAAICELGKTMPCPPGWKVYSTNCYLFTPYNNQSVLYTQSEASNYCARAAPGKGAKLLSINDKNEKAFIKSQVASMSTNVYGWYTSLNDKVNEGTWAFADSPVTDPSLIDWQGEPNTSPGSDCGMLNFGAVVHMINCNAVLGYICEKQAVNPVGPAPVGTTKAPPSGNPGVSSNTRVSNPSSSPMSPVSTTRGNSAATSRLSVALVSCVVAVAYLL